jgi:hypothetical protein
MSSINPLSRAKRSTTGAENASASETNKTFATGRAATETQRGPTAKTKAGAIERLFRQALAAITGRSTGAAHGEKRKQKEKDEERGGMVWKAAKKYTRILTAARHAGRPDKPRDRPHTGFRP